RLELRRNSGGTWDTDAATSFWALGVSAALDGALLNAGNGAVNVAIADGGAVYLFAADANPPVFTTGSSFTVSANFADGTSASASVTLSPMPTISSVTPSTGAPGTAFAVAVTGTHFQPGASASFGTDVTVNSTTVTSSTQLSVSISVGATATMGPRDVTVTNPDSQVAIRQGGFTVAPPAPTLGLAFLGKLRDKVAASPTTYSADGALDGTFRMTLQSGSGARTLTRLELRRNGGGTWDTDAVTSFWALGVSAALDSALLNAGNGAVNVAIGDGGAVYLFAADANPPVLTTGSSFTVSANFADGTSASASVILAPMPSIAAVSPNSGAPGGSLIVTVTGTSFQTGATASFGADVTVTSTTVVSSTQLSVALAIGTTAAMGPRDVTVTNPDGQVATRAGGFTVMTSPPTLSLAFQGKLRDKVGASPTGFSPDGALDGTFRVTVEAGSGARTVTRLELRKTSGGAIWDTDPATSFWALGAAADLDSALLNNSSGVVNFAVADGAAFYIFAADFNPSLYISGTSFSLTGTFADGSVVTVTTTVP